MERLILSDPDAVAAAGAEMLAAAAKEIPDLVLGLPTGRTAVPFYDELARLHESGALDLSAAYAFNLDELLLPRAHPASFYAYMERHAWQRIGLRREHCDIPNPAVDPAAECRRYDEEIERIGGFDLAFLGVGADGHVAYNLPGEPLGATHVVELPTELAEAMNVSKRWRPLRAITVGLEALRSARRLVLMATGGSKRAAVRALVQGPEDPEWPCTLLREHSDFTVLVNRDAAPM